MKKELQEKLYEKYPSLFAQKDLSPKLTAMCWGLCVGDGWYDLIDKLCFNITAYTEMKQRKGITLDIQVTQVKEKYGGLRFYLNHGDEYIYGLTSMAEAISYDICTECGNKSSSEEQRGWIYTLCKPCRNEDSK
jgi:hypothetical protein